MKHIAILLAFLMTLDTQAGADHFNQGNYDEANDL